MVLVKRFCCWGLSVTLSYKSKETILLAMDPHYGNLNSLRTQLSSCIWERRGPPPPVWNWTTKVSFPHVVLKLISDRPQVLAEAIPYARIRGLSLIATLCGTVSFATFRGLLDFRTPLRVSLAANILNACLVACPSLISLKPSNLDFRDAKLTLTHFQEWPQGPTSYVWLWLGSLGCGCCHIHRRALLRSDFHARAFEQALI